MKVGFSRFCRHRFSTLTPRRDIDRREVFELLSIKTFEDKEIEESFQKLSNGQQTLNAIALRSAVKETVTSFSGNPIEAEYKTAREKGMAEIMFGPKFQAPDAVLTLSEYRTKVRLLGEKIDKSVVYPMVGSFLLTGASIGIVVPCMPLLVQHLELTSFDLGLVISSLGLAKLAGNIPAAYFVDQLGRKPMIVAGLSLCSVGIAGISMAVLCPSLPALPVMMGCRFVTGLGVSCFTAGAYLMMSDVSTALNRARTMSPVQTGFQAGIAMGPAIGGVAIETIGIPSTYITCGVLFSAIGALNKIYLKESMLPTFKSVPPAQLTSSTSPGLSNSSLSSPESTTTLSEPSNILSKHPLPLSSLPPSAPLPPTRASWRGVLGSFSVASSSWAELLTLPRMRDVCLMNGAYWTALAGVQMTVLPLFMVGDTLSLGAQDIGGAYAFMSVASVLCTHPAAYIADKKGKVPAMLAGCGLLSVSMSMIPFATNYVELLAVLLPFSIGSTVLQAIPTPYVADVVPMHQRSQALSLLRTVGDVGLLVGACGSGLLMHLSSMQATVHGNASLLLGAMAFLGAKHFWATRRVK